MKGIVEDYLKIDVRTWQREGLLSPGIGFRWGWSGKSSIIARVQAEHVVLYFRSQVQTIILATSECHLGGSRRWFRCGCGKRAAILYAGAQHFACRDCYNLNYQTQHQQPLDRLASKAHKLRDQLGWPRGFLSGHETKPKGMHWRTFERRSIAAENAVDECNLAARAKFPDYHGFE